MLIKLLSWGWGRAPTRLEGRLFKKGGGGVHGLMVAVLVWQAGI